MIDTITTLGRHQHAHHKRINANQINLYYFFQIFKEQNSF